AIEQRVHFADDRSHKYKLLDHLLSDVAMRQSIVFMSTKRDAEALAVKLQGEGHAAAALHGDMNQHERNRTLSDLRRGGVRAIVERRATRSNIGPWSRTAVGACPCPPPSLWKACTCPQRQTRRFPTQVWT